MKLMAWSPPGNVLFSSKQGFWYGVQHPATCFQFTLVQNAIQTTFSSTKLISNYLNIFKKKSYMATYSLLLRYLRLADKIVCFTYLVSYVVRQKPKNIEFTIVLNSNRQFLKVTEKLQGTYGTYYWDIEREYLWRKWQVCKSGFSLINSLVHTCTQKNLISKPMSLILKVWNRKLTKSLNCSLTFWGLAIYCRYVHFFI